MVVAVWHGMMYTVVTCALLAIAVVTRASFGTKPMKLASAESGVAAFSPGCFSGPQQALHKLPGVLQCDVGYMGGSNFNPSNQSTCGGDEHFETMRVTYDTDTLFI